MEENKNLDNKEQEEDVDESYDDLDDTTNLKEFLNKHGIR